MARRWLRRTVTDPIEAALSWLVYGLFRALPLDAASALGGRLLRLIGPRLPVARRAERNLRRAMPELDDARVAEILAGMWDNLGRVLGEYPHLDSFDLYGDDPRVEVVGVENVDRARDDGVGGIFFSGHLGNWELASLSCTQRGIPLVHIYRSANNPLVERLIRRARLPIGGAHYPKGAGGARQLVAALKRGDHLAMLVDQKLNEGLPVPFFGHDAMTAPVVAEFALRFKVPVIPARVVRLRGATFRIELLPPMALPDTGDRRADVHEIMRRINARFEAWIREHPDQWLWPHRRWPD